jgi:drug/metabolite transporter (DMT)-like permease
MTSTAAAKRTTTPSVAASLLATNIAIGSVSFTLVALSLEELSPLSLATGRVVVSALTFAAVVLARPQLRRPIARGDRLKVFYCGFAGSVAFHVLFQWGQQRVTVAVAAVTMATYPVLTSLGEVVFLRYRLRAAQAAGVICAVLGCVLIALASSDAAGTVSLLGVLAIAGASVSWAGVTVITRGLGDRYDSWWLNAPGTVVGGFAMLAISAPRLHEFADLSFQGWLAVVWLGSASSAFIYFSLAKVLTVISATTTTAITSVVTPMSIVVAWAVLGQRPSGVELVGAAVVVAGVVLATRSGGELAGARSRATVDTSA